MKRARTSNPSSASILLALFVVVVSLPTLAQAPTNAAKKAAESKLKIATPKVGQYITEQGWSVLDVMTGKDGAPKFRIDSVGINGHSCLLEGTIESGIATLKDDPDVVCRVSFAATSSGVTVADASDFGCRTYCGARASFDGDYRVPAAGCNTHVVRANREKFKKAYDKKQFAEAETYLSPIVARCGLKLSRWEDPSIRNDLAITYFHLKNKAACLATFAPLQALADDDDTSINEEYSYAPSDAEGMLNIAKATRVNLKKCRSL